MKPVRIKTHGKVNLFWRVLGKRADGFHEIETVLQVIDIADEIDIVPVQSGRVDVEVSLIGELGGAVPEPHENLVTFASEKLIAAGARNDGVVIKIRKGVPIGAGLGGGSGNAAGVLVVLNEMWKAGLDHDELKELAGAVGSDVPYCVDGGTALATARGEKLTPLPSPEELWLVLGIMEKPLSTAEVYDAWDEIETHSDVSSAPMTLALGAGDVPEIASLMHNDLEPAAFVLRPELEDKKAAFLEAGALGAVMSGSGPTIFGVARDEEHARSLAAAVRDHFDRVVPLTSRGECIERLD